MSLKEVSCSTLTIFFKNFEENNIPLELLCEGIPYNLDYLKNKKENIEWDVVCKILLNIRKIWNDDNHFVNLGMQMVQRRAYPLFSILPGLFFNIQDCYRLINDPKKGIGNRAVKCIKPNSREVEKGHLEVTLELPADHAYSREFFLITKGFFIALPIFLKLNLSKVILREADHCAVYNIFYPPNNKAFSWIRSIFSMPSSKRAAVSELNEAYELLYDRFHQLEESRAKIQIQAKQLETAYSISQLITGDLDLEYTLKAIAKSLVEVAGFEAAEVFIEAEIDGEKIYRYEKSGSKVIDSIQIERILQGHGQNIGKLILWTSTKSKNENEEKLLDYIIPSISMQLLSSLSFKLVDDYRNRLEHKVNERTEQLNYANEELTLSLERLKELKIARDRFFASISHEFRTPLTLILGPNESILSNSGEEETRKKANLIKQNANRMLSLINQLLDLARLDAGKLNLNVSKGNIVSFVKGITMSFESLAERKGIKLSIDSSDDQIELYFDKEMMIKILTNLLSNAFKFTKTEGQITVTIYESGVEFVEIKLKDTGIGISEEEFPKLFDRFYQVDSSHTREYEGTGIGLALTKELVELHHGTITVDSRLWNNDIGETGWTEFTIMLPSGKTHFNDSEIIEMNKQSDSVVQGDVKKLFENVNESTPSELMQLNPPINNQNSSSKTQNENHNNEEKTLILIVEDNTDVRRFIKDALGDDYQIEEASNGEEGVSKAEKIIPDLIICDIMMPRLDGNELTRILKNNEKTSHIPIILLTAKAGQESKIEGLKTGADDYLIKPFDTTELKVIIKNRIDLRRSLQKKYSSSNFIGNQNKIELSNLDEQFLFNVMKIIDNHLSEEDFSIEQLNKEIGMGRVQVYRKIKALTGSSPSRYIRTIRLSKAMLMLKENKINISEIAYSVGFSTPAYFAKCFKEEFGYAPSELVR